MLNKNAELYEAQNSQPQSIARINKRLKVKLSQGPEVRISTRDDHDHHHYNILVRRDHRVLQIIFEASASVHLRLLYYV